MQQRTLLLIDDDNVWSGMTAKDGKSDLSMGAGLMALGAQLDYAVSPETGLGSVQRITLKKKF